MATRVAKTQQTKMRYFALLSLSAGLAAGVDAA
jgi:hypothetical protein